MDDPAAIAAAPIAEIREDDVAAVAALHARCFDEAWRPALIGRIAKAPGGFGLLWRSADEPLGFVLGRTNHARAEVLSLGVAPASRERGIARALMHAAIDRVSRRGLRELYLEVAEDNTPAQRLYRALGFATVGRRPRYYARPETEAVDALTLRRAIVPVVTPAAAPRSVSGWAG